MTKITLTKIEHALLMGLLFTQDTHCTEPMTLTTEDREMVGFRALAGTAVGTTIAHWRLINKRWCNSAQLITR